jgi:proto-chlorophyllide reductase subunit
LISTFDWTNEATQRIFRVPAGFMRNKTQERIEELARERAAAVIDLALVEEGIEIGKRMMAEMIATYSAPGASPGTATTARDSAGHSAIGPDAVDSRTEATATAAQEAPASKGSGYLNEVSSLAATPRQV